MGLSTTSDDETEPPPGLGHDGHRREAGAVASILLIDDDPVASLFLGRLFESSGYAALHAATGLEGIEAVRTHRPDLVFIDLVLPDMAGTEVARGIRSDLRLRRIPLVALSASTWDLQEVRAANFVDHVFLPIDDIVRFIRRLSCLLQERTA